MLSWSNQKINISKHNWASWNITHVQDFMAQMRWIGAKLRSEIRSIQYTSSLFFKNGVISEKATADNGMLLST